MKVDYLHIQGSAEVSEDGVIFSNPNFLGVVDGLSSAYPPKKYQKLFHGMTGGQFVANFIVCEFNKIYVGGLADSLEKANVSLAFVLSDKDYNLEDSGLLPGACFAIIHLRKKEIDIIQGGDCLAVWEKKDGEKSGTKNQVFDYEKDIKEEIIKLMEKHARDRIKARQDFISFLAERRRKNFNKEFAIFNGQQSFKEHWQRITLKKEEIKRMILFTDGFVDYSWTEDPDDLAKRLTEYYKTSGLSGILSKTREANHANRFLSFEDYPEATAIAVEF